MVFIESKRAHRFFLVSLCMSGVAMEFVRRQAAAEARLSSVTDEIRDPDPSAAVLAAFARGDTQRAGLLVTAILGVCVDRVCARVRAPRSGAPPLPHKRMAHGMAARLRSGNSKRETALMLSLLVCAKQSPNIFISIPRRASLPLPLSLSLLWFIRASLA